MEGQRRREQAKKSLPASTTPSPSRQRKKVDLGDLLTLGNVELHRTKPTATDKRKKTGLNKVVHYALWERGLTHDKNVEDVPVGRSSKTVVEGTRAVPEFGSVLSAKGAAFLAKQTKALDEAEA